MHRRTFATVQQAELDSSRIRNFRHDSVQCVDLSHEMPLAKPADGRVAGHDADVGPFHRDQRRGGTTARGGMRSFASGVPASDNEDIKLFHVKHSHHFPMQKLENISSSRFSTPIRPTKDSRDRIEVLISSAAIS